MIEYLKMILPILAALTTVIWGIIQYFKDRFLKIYTENINNLFSEDKGVVLSTIATLDFFKDDKKFKNNVIDILVNRLYTELDYEIVNAVITELSQVGTEKEFKYLSQKLLDINRNFEIQGLQITERSNVLSVENDEIVEKYNQIPYEDKLKEEELKFVVKSKRLASNYKALSDYKLKWHKQVVGEAFAMLLLEANRKGLTSSLDIKLFENNLSNNHLFNFKLNRLHVLYAAFKNASLQELEINNVLFEHTFFEETLLRRSLFKGGKISNVEFVNTKLDWVTFENVEFEEVYFIGVKFNKCTFKNVKGVDQKLFFNCMLISDCNVIDSDLDFEELNNTRKGIEEALNNSNRSMWGREYIKKKLLEQA